VLTKYQPFYRKRSKKECTTLQELKDVLDEAFGLRVQNTPELVKDFIRQVLNIAVSERNKLFPAPYYAVVKALNKSNSSEGLMANLGYTCIVPSVDKVIKLTTATFKSVDGVAKEIIPMPKEEQTLNRDSEFVMGAKLLLPYLTLSSEENLKKQLKAPMMGVSVQARDFWKQQSTSVDELNRAYAFLSAKDKKKTKPVHVQNAQGKASRYVSSNMPFMDASGNKYQEYMDLDIGYRRVLEKLLKRKFSPGKRKERTGAASDEIMDIDQGQSPESAPSPKKQKNKTRSDKSQSRKSTGLPKR
jgi:hypothetical protein